ncbi:prolyl 4-hydroxylase subunit alpha-1-like [Scleropages formosus]|uniref:prolyl 4-hydroxylase subunit alpha-1-like n=1 Tax=Scleropages formosus TaxID=113540 RepID=UPI0010FA6DC6|nr:prolyl 4-hydroxylase subunit alpha-1-like [Scleropages formosus]
MLWYKIKLTVYLNVKNQQAPRNHRVLSCRYSTGRGNPRLIYSPVKEEDEWDHPPIIRYHNFLSDKEIETLKRLSRTKLERSQVTDEYGDHATENRVSKSASLFEEEDPVVSRISQRIADVTGLDMETAEILQVTNYSIGGHFKPHFDTQNWNNHQRIATFLTYMTDVEFGGATVFPNIGVALQPQKGSAVFWYNLLRNGQLDERTLHAACPVVAGSKWVANKWIREQGQEFRRPCALSEWV